MAVSSKMQKAIQKFTSDVKPFTIREIATESGESYENVLRDTWRMFQLGRFGFHGAWFALTVIPPAPVAKKVKETRYQKSGDDNGEILTFFPLGGLLNAARSIGANSNSEFSRVITSHAQATLWPKEWAAENPPKIAVAPGIVVSKGSDIQPEALADYTAKTAVPDMAMETPLLDTSGPVSSETTASPEIAPELASGSPSGDGSAPGGNMEPKNFTSVAAAAEYVFDSLSGDTGITVVVKAKAGDTSFRLSDVPKMYGGNGTKPITKTGIENWIKNRL